MYNRTHKRTDGRRLTKIHQFTKSTHGKPNYEFFSRHYIPPQKANGKEVYTQTKYTALFRRSATPIENNSSMNFFTVLYYKLPDKTHGKVGRFKDQSILLDDHRQAKIRMRNIEEPQQK